jgi:diguanylate cyclase
MDKQTDMIDQIKALLEAGSIAPTPINYEFWYRYLTGTDPQLVAAVDAALANEQPLTRRMVDMIRREVLGASDGEDVLAIAARASEHVKRLAEFVEQTSGDARSYNGKLKDGQSALGAEIDEAAQRATLAELVRATAAMIDKTERLEQQLAHSAEEIAALREDLEAARSESRTDPLTGLSNRKAFNAYLEVQAARALADRKPLSLMFCDIDHFKQFNDTWGHRMGDEVLRLVGQSLEQLCHGIGHPARFGGEEFVIVLPGRALEAATDIGEQFRDYVGTRTLRAKQTNREVGRVTLSLGVAQLRWTDTVESLVERADTALYRAKATGRNRVCTETEIEDADEGSSAAVA